MGRGLCTAGPGLGFMERTGQKAQFLVNSGSHILKAAGHAGAFLLKVCTHGPAVTMNVGQRQAGQNQLIR